jgi:hypothetical protein
MLFFNNKNVTTRPLLLNVRGGKVARRPSSVLSFDPPALFTEIWIVTGISFAPAVVIEIIALIHLQLLKAQFQLLKTQQQLLKAQQQLLKAQQTTSQSPSTASQSPARASQSPATASKHRNSFSKHSKPLLKAQQSTSQRPSTASQSPATASKSLATASQSPATASKQRNSFSKHSNSLKAKEQLLKAQQSTSQSTATVSQSPAKHFSKHTTAYQSPAKHYLKASNSFPKSSNSCSKPTNSFWKPSNKWDEKRNKHAQALTFFFIFPWELVRTCRRRRTKNDAISSLLLLLAHRRPSVLVHLWDKKHSCFIAHSHNAIYENVRIPASPHERETALIRDMWVSPENFSQEFAQLVVAGLVFKKTAQPASTANAVELSCEAIN